MANIVPKDDDAEEKLKESFLQSYASTGSIEESMHCLDPDGIYKNSPTALFKKAQNIMRENNSSVQAVAEKKGLTLAKIIDVVLEGLEAAKIAKDKGGMVLRDDNGNPLFTPDYDTRLKAAQIAAQIWGVPGFGKTVTNTKNIQNNLFTASRELGARLQRK